MLALLGWVSPGTTPDHVTAMAGLTWNPMGFPDFKKWFCWNRCGGVNKTVTWKSVTSKKKGGPKFQGDCFRVKCCFKTFRVNMGEQVKCSWSQNLLGEQMINLVSKNYELRKFVPVGWLKKTGFNSTSGRQSATPRLWPWWRHSFEMNDDPIWWPTIWVSKWFQTIIFMYCIHIYMHMILWYYIYK